MRLTLFTDYSIRVLLYLGTRPERLCSIAEVARGYDVSQNHLMKVVNELARAGYVESVRGRRSEEHTSELQSLMRISYAVFCLKKKNTKTDVWRTLTRNLTQIRNTNYSTRTH